MTQEEKAKAYDEALEKFDVILNLSTVKESGTIFVDDVIKVFPELKESEDERIRKDCIKYLNLEYQHCPLNEDKIKIEKCIAWIEKQDEQKELREIEKKSIEGTFIIINSVPYCDSRKEYSDWLKSLKDKHTWKPSDEQMWALSTLANTPRNVSDICKKTAQELLEQLKKLKEE